MSYAPLHPLVAQAILDRTLTITDLRVLIAITQNPGKNRNFIAEAAGINPRQVLRSAKQLESMDLIKVTQKRWVYNGEPHKENAYYLGDTFDEQPPLPSFEQFNNGTSESYYKTQTNIGTPESSSRQNKFDNETPLSHYRIRTQPNVNSGQKEDSGVPSLPKGTLESSSCMMHDDELFNSTEEQLIYEQLDFLQGSNRYKAARSKRVTVELAMAWKGWILSRQYGNIENPPGFAFSEMIKGIHPPTGQVQLPADIVDVESIPVTDWPTEVRQDSLTREDVVWQETKNILQRQMTRATYDAVIQGTRLDMFSSEDHVAVVGVKTDMAKEWLENRLRDVIERTLASVIGVESIGIEFVVLSGSIL